MALHRAILKPLARDARKNAWILEASWILLDKRVSARRDPAKDQNLIWRLSRAIEASLSDNRRRQAEELGAEVEALLGSDPPLHREAWKRIKGWYQPAFDCALPSDQVYLERITAERVELYSYVPLPGTNIPIFVDPLPVDDSVPMENKIERVVKQICNHRSGGPSGMQGEHLKRWLAATKKKAKEGVVAGEETTEGNRGGRGGGYGVYGAYGDVQLGEGG